jgi:hypothetical protein
MYFGMLLFVDFDFLSKIMCIYWSMIHFFLFLFKIMSPYAAILCYSRDTNSRMRFEVRLTRNHFWLGKGDTIIVCKVYYYSTKLWMVS